jgi:hypothetical protein
MEKLNCWEFKNCGRQVGGEKVRDLGVCPAATESRLNGVHGGVMAGRTCWVVAGSMCGGQLQGTFAQKYEDCQKCDFYEAVKKEEGDNLEMSVMLLNRIKSVSRHLKI